MSARQTRLDSIPANVRLLLWIPGSASIFDQVWLAANGVLSTAIGYLTLKR